MLVANRSAEFIQYEEKLLQQPREEIASASGLPSSPQIDWQKAMESLFGETDVTGQVHLIIGVKSTTLLSCDFSASVLKERFLWQTALEGESRFAARARLEDLKAKHFRPETRELRISKALNAIENLKPIQGLERKVWRKIAEESDLTDQYAG